VSGPGSLLRSQGDRQDRTGIRIRQSTWTILGMLPENLRNTRTATGEVVGDVLSNPYSVLLCA